MDRSKKFWTALLFSTLIYFLLQASTFAQERVQLPNSFTRISESVGSLPEQFAEAARQFKNKADGDRYWVGYHFELHQGIDFSGYRIFLHDNGGVSFFKGDGHWSWENSDDENLETSVHRALAELGEEASKKFLKRRKKTYSQNEDDYAVYFLIDPQAGKVERIHFLDFEHLNRLRDLPVYWLGNVNIEQSFEFLRTIIDDDGDEEVQEHAVFVLTQHGDKEEVARMLIDIAKNHRSPKVRKKAIFWLSQTDDEQALSFFKEILAK
ncbi:MAG: HEAT repeat domain-containing protein [bacterium]